LGFGVGMETKPISIASRKATTPKTGVKLIKALTSPCVRQGYHETGVFIDVIVAAGKHQARIIGGSRTAGIDLGGPRDGDTDAHIDAVLTEACAKLTDLRDACGGKL